MEQYRLLAECLLPARMLDWFDLKTVRVEKKGDTQVIHLYLDENEQKPDDGEDLRPNGFTRESVFHDFPIRGQEVLLHVRRRRWLDADGHNVMTECNPIRRNARYYPERLENGETRAYQCISRIPQCKDQAFQSTTQRYY